MLWCVARLPEGAWKVMTLENLEELNRTRLERGLSLWGLLGRAESMMGGRRVMAELRLTMTIPKEETEVSEDA